MTPAVVLFAREPEAGRSKTRLASDLGEAAALRLYEALVEDLSRPGLLAPGWAGVVAHPGARPGPVLARAFGGFRFRPRGPGSPGEQVWRAVASESASGHGPVVVVASAVPALSRDDLAAAVEAAAGRAAAAAAPSPGGGVPLLAIGPGADPSFLLAPVRWDTPRAFEDLAGFAAAAGIPFVRLPELVALERGADLPAALGAAAAGSAPRTLELLREMEVA